MLRIFLFGQQKHRKQPKRYAKRKSEISEEAAAASMPPPNTKYSLDCLLQT
jgi:hypothetical protein